MMPRADAVAPRVMPPRGARFEITPAGQSALAEPATDLEATVTATVHPKGITGRTLGLSVDWRDVDGASGTATMYVVVPDAGDFFRFFGRVLPWAVIDD